MALQGEILSEYIIKDLRIPSTEEYETDIEWICKCFGFLESRDKEKTAARIFKALLESVKQGRGLSSDKLAEDTGLTRGTMVHHLNKMIRSGLVVHREGQYELRSMSMQRTIQEIRRDIERVFEDIIHIAKSIDENLDLVYR